MRLSAAEPVLDTIAKVRALPWAEAARGLPVRLEATVIFYDSGKSRCLFIQDDTAATYVSLQSAEGKELLPPSIPLETGARIRIEATTKVGGYFPDLELKQIDLLGKGPLPKPRQIGEDELFAPALDCQWVEVPAVVTGVESDENMSTLAVEVHGWKLNARIPRDEHFAEHAAALMQRPVRLQGVAGTAFTPRRQMAGRFFFVPSFDQIIPVDQTAPNSPLPLRKVSELLRSEYAATSLVRIEGVVTQTAGTDFYLRDESGSVMVRTAKKVAFVPGDRVEAEGFAAIAPFHPILRARKVALIGRTAPPQPMTLDFDTEKFALFQAELIGLDADLLARRDGKGEITLQCRTGDRFFEALLPTDGTLPKDLAPGDRVRLTGICELTTTRPLTDFWNVNGFRLHLPRTGGVSILRHAPWWTLKHLLIVIGIMSAVAFVTSIWVVLLGYRVKAQTKIIGNQIKKAAVHDERQRIARELHDTVEQELASLSMQMGAISDEIEEEPARVPAPIRSSVHLAKQILRHCREDARASVRDLRGIELEHRGLPGALQELLPVAATPFGADFEMQVAGTPRPIAAIAESHLLRIAQEGVANAARHADARKISVNLDYTPETVTLSIRDDGCGFDPASPTPVGHFGLLGMRERANKMQAGIEIESAPGKGTMIRVVVPTNNQ